MTSHHVKALDEALPQQRWAWKAERVGWVIMVLILAAALLGLFGSGPLATGRASGEADALRVEYARFARYQSPATMRVYVQPPLPPPEGEIRLAVSRDFLDAMNLEGITPWPDAMKSGDGMVVMTFRDGGGDRPLLVRFDYRPTAIGLHRGQIGVIPGPWVDFRPFVYP
jgi:hypothetical protein